ncbi:FUSC family protein [Candidatus Allofournierella excrementavium]|uniref:FUSC family protein n=1 Tax=Candidatus Allofournierella excrementavium TaxID=2838591 RepID=UPI003AF57F4D
MTTKFYDALQLDPSILKRRIAACETKKEKNFYRAAMAVRSALIVAFAILFISLLSGLFGADNTPMAVALFCMLLGIRFVNFEYCAGDSLAGLALVAPLHFAAFFALLFLTSQRPEMGNGGIYSFAYIYLTGNPVAGEALARRGLMALAGWLLCGAILLAKHRGRHADTRFHHLVRRFRLSRPECLWRLRMALGVSLVLAAGQVFGVERFMWMGFACGSLQSEYPLPGSAAVRFWQRIAGAAAGCAAFALLYLALPAGLRPLLGPLGGFCMGFCTDYRYKTAMNCFGALMIGAGLYGLSGAVALRLADTVLSAAFGLCFAALFHRLSRRLLPAADPAR